MFYFNYPSLIKRQGFTLIELLVSISIIIALTSIGFVNFRVTSQKSRNSKREADIAQVRAALEIYRSTYTTYPIYTGANRTTNFNNLIANNSFKIFLSTPTLVDPMNTGTYTYTYFTAANGFTYTLCYTTEPAATQVCLNNP